MASLSDDFARANQTDLGTAAGGWSWSKVTPSGGGGNVNVASNAAKGTTGAFIQYRADGDLAGSDHYAEVRIVSGWVGDRCGPGPCVRCAAASAQCYAVLARLDLAAGRLYAVDASGNYSQLGADFTISATLPTTIRLEASGTALTVKQDGATVATRTDSTIAGNTRGGLVCYSPDASQPVLDDWAAADLGGGAAGQPAMRRLGGVGGGRPVEIGREGVLVYRAFPADLRRWGRENAVLLRGLRG